MNARFSIAFGVVLCVYGVSTAASTTPFESSQGACGRTSTWSFPEHTRVEATADDSRSYETLVTQARVTQIILAASRYCVSHGGSYPTSFDEMFRFRATLPGGDRGCTIEDHVLKDGWEQPIFYWSDGDTFVVISAGEDGRFTTNDDVARPDSTDKHAEVVDVRNVCRPG